MKKQRMGPALLLPVLAILIVTGCDDDAANPASQTRAYTVTIQNLSSEQPFSPGVVVTHTDQESLFEMGASASEGIRLIAENGDPSVAVTELAGAAAFEDVVATTAPIGCDGCPGGFASSLEVEVEAPAGTDRLSLAVMLICTNDGFTGLSGVELPSDFQPQTVMAGAYDAGTEANDELYTSIVDPCGAIGPVPAAADSANNRTATAGVITQHPGITGAGDLDPASHGWNDPVAMITIERIR